MDKILDKKKGSSKLVYNFFVPILIARSKTSTYVNIYRYIRVQYGTQLDNVGTQLGKILYTKKTLVKWLTLC